MARIFRATYTARNKNGQRVTKTAKKWYIEYRDADGRPRRVAGFTDKAATLQRAAELERLAAQQQAGLVDRFQEHRKRPLRDHLNDWQASLEAVDSKAHADKQRYRAGRIIDGCRFKVWSDLSASKVQTFVAGLRKGTKPVSMATANCYLQAIKEFTQWLARDGRAPDNPLTYLKGGNPETDRRRVRRALADDELRCLLQAARIGPEMYGITGPERAVLYQLAVETGLRQNEARTLTPDACDLDGVPPTIAVRAGYCKTGRADDLPLRPGMVNTLRPLVEATGRDGQVFPVPDARRQVTIALRADLAAGRALWIKEAKSAEDQNERERSDFLAYCDHAGRYADFHALRHTFITNLARGGVAPKLAMDLARHTDINLTMGCYSHTVVADRAKAIEVLPDLEQKAEPGQLQATGTYDAPPSDNKTASGETISDSASRVRAQDEKSLASSLASQGAFPFPNHSSQCAIDGHPGIEAPTGKPSETPVKMGGLCASVQDDSPLDTAPEGTRSPGIASAPSVLGKLGPAHVSPTPVDTYDDDEKRLASCLAFLRRILPDLALIVERWDTLPEHLRQVIGTLVESVTSKAANKQQKGAGHAR